MASTRNIANRQVDQENRRPELRQKVGNNAMAAQEKRSVLRVIDNNKPHKVAIKGKQALKESKASTSREVQQNKKVVVPVAQFEAFSVYEDEEHRAKIDQKLRQLSKSNVYKGTADDKFITKTELAEIENKKRLEKLKVFDNIDKIEFETEPETPMSIDRSRDDSLLAEDVILRNSNQTSNRNIFFEVEDYRSEIYAYLREHEMRHRPKAGYIVKQPDVTVNMRAILVDWLVEVVQEYKMNTETLYLAVNFIDRFLSYMSVVRAKLQLVGTAAMFIAAKYEEVVCPHVSEFVYITDDTYDQRQVIRMEHLILRVLGFDVSIPTPLTFINAMCIMGRFTEKVMYLAMYLSELALLDVEPYLQFLPSMIAASALALARHTLGNSAWDSDMEAKTGYELKKLEKCIAFLYEIFVNAPNNPQHAIQDKYKSSKYMQVSKISPKNELIQFD